MDNRIDFFNSSMMLGKMYTNDVIDSITHENYILNGIINTPNSLYKFFPIKSIIFGCKMPKEEKQEYVELAKMYSMENYTIHFMVWLKNARELKSIPLLN